MKTRAICLTVTALLFATYVSNNAFASGYNQKKQQLDAMYHELLGNPTDLDLTMRYAELAVELGDYEAAIPPMERLLMNNPNVPKIKLELGILYYLLGSYDMSKTYLVQAKESAASKPEIKQQADSYLSRM